MPSYYVPLPSAEVPRNALLNFAPINNALEGIRNQNNENRNALMRTREFDAQQDERQYQHGRQQKADQRADEQYFAKAAEAFSRLAPNDPARSNWTKLVRDRHPDPGSLGLEYLDPVNGPKLVMSEFGVYRDPRDDQMKNLDLQAKQAQIKSMNGNADPTALRAKQLQAAGVDPNSQEGKAFLLTGNYSAKPVYTPAETAVDKTFAKSYENDVATGGLADAEKNLAQLKGVRDELTNPDGSNLTGPLLGRVPDAVASFTNPKAVDARERVEEVVQRNLRLILGAQFTQNEGFALIKRAYNPTLDEATNARRLNRLISAMEQALQAKKQAAKYYEENGTLKGFKGKIDYSITDFESAIDDRGAPNLGAGPAPATTRHERGANTPLPRPRSEADFERMASGTRFLAPDGTVRVKP